MIAVTPDLLTYVREIDEQHEKLFDLINAVEAAGNASNTKEETEKALGFLGAYVTEHFSREEGMMRESGYPEHEWHANWHQGYISKFNNLKEEYNKNGPSAEFTNILEEFIMKWIVTHIRNVDVDLGKHINSHRK